MRTMLRWMIGVYLIPILSIGRLYAYVQDIFFSRNGLHIRRSLDYIKSTTDLEQVWILDVGCHGNGFIQRFRHKFPQASVIGFEPNKAKYTEANLFFSRDNFVQIKNLALGRKPGTNVLKITDFDFSSSILSVSEKVSENEDGYEIVHEQECQVSTLDQETLSLTEILLIKIDTQGYELEVLKGGGETLKKTRFILLELSNHEIYLGAPKYFEVDQYLREKGFNLIQIYSPLSDASEYDALYQNNIFSN